MDEFKTKDGFGSTLAHEIASHIKVRYAGKYICEHTHDSARELDVVTVRTLGNSPKSVFRLLAQSMFEGGRVYVSVTDRKSGVFDHTFALYRKDQDDFSDRQRAKIERLVREQLEPRVLGVRVPPKAILFG